MPSEFLDPNANINTLWSAFEFTSIDDGVRDPTVPSLDIVRANQNDDDELQEWGMENPVETYSEITTIEIKHYAELEDGTSDGDINLRVGGSLQTAQAMNLVTSLAWRSNTFTGNFSQSDVDSLQVIVDSNTRDKDENLRIHALYAEITGTDIPAINVNDSITVSESVTIDLSVILIGSLGEQQGIVIITP